MDKSLDAMGNDAGRMAPRPDSRTAPAALLDRVRDLAALVTTPLLPQDYLDRIDPLGSTTSLRGRIVALLPETRDAATVVIRPGAGWRGHRPGQYVRLGIDVDGVRQWRSYSLTWPADRADGCIAITVTAVPDGVVSGHLVRRARVGTLVHLDQAAGDFVLPTVTPTKALFVTGGSGITPVMGMLRASLDDLDDVVVVHSARTAADVVFGGELRMLHGLGRIRLIERHTQSDGRLDRAQLLALVPDLAERETWACGPTGLLDEIEALHAELGLRDRLHVERFRPVLRSTGTGGAVTFTRTGTTVDADGSSSLLDAGEAAGVLMPSGCRMGICFGCVVPLREGSVRDLRDGAVTTARPGDGVLIQTCVSAAAGACDLDL
jgi:ferredoxin-NADP reductase